MNSDHRVSQVISYRKITIFQTLWYKMGISYKKRRHRGWNRSIQNQKIILPGYKKRRPCPKENNIG